MDDRGSSMTDTAPLVKMKQAMQKLKGEIKQMELRIGTRTL
jgi:estrogen-related receptor beta like 1